MGINIYDPSKALGDKITELDRKSLCELCSAPDLTATAAEYTRPISASETTATSPSARDAARISARKK